GEGERASPPGVHATARKPRRIESVRRQKAEGRRRNRRGARSASKGHLPSAFCLLPSALCLLPSALCLHFFRIQLDFSAETCAGWIDQLVPRHARAVRTVAVRTTRGPFWTGCRSLIFGGCRCHAAHHLRPLWPVP